VIRTFNFNSDIIPKNNVKDRKFDWSSSKKIDLIKPLRRIHRFEFSQLNDSATLSDGAYKIAIELYGKYWADNLKQEVEKFEEINKALFNLKSSLNINDIKSLQTKPIKSTLTELQQRDSPSDMPNEIPIKLNEDGDIYEHEIDDLIEALNKRDQEVIDNHYTYPYGDEPIDNESEDRAIKDWIHKAMLRYSNDDDKRLNLIMIVAETIMSAWKTDKSLYRIMYGYYLAKDLYKIGIFFKFNHYELINCINNVIGMDIDWNKFNQEALLLNDKIGFGLLIWKQLEALNMNRDLSFKEIKKETDNITLEINKWAESVHVGTDQI
jgi:hypothetical protein